MLVQMAVVLRQHAAVPVGHQHDLESVAELAIAGRAEQGVEALDLSRRQVNTGQGGVSNRMGDILLGDATASMGSCIRRTED